MKVKGSKADLLAYDMFSIWPTYASTDDVPADLKAQVNSGESLVLMVNILGTPNTLQAWNGTTWLVIGKSGGSGEVVLNSTTYANAPTTHVPGEAHYASDLKLAMASNGTDWHSMAIAGNNGEPAAADGKFQGQAWFRVETGELYVYTGTTWYKFTGVAIP